jgi:hypothetical protein
VNASSVFVKRNTTAPGHSIASKKAVELAARFAAGMPTVLPR